MACQTNENLNSYTDVMLGLSCFLVGVLNSHSLACMFCSLGSRYSWLCMHALLYCAIDNCTRLPDHIRTESLGASAHMDTILHHIVYFEQCMCSLIGSFDEKLASLELTVACQTNENLNSCTVAQMSCPGYHAFLLAC